MEDPIDTDSQDVINYLDEKWGAGHGHQGHLLTDEDRRIIAARRRAARRAKPVAATAPDRVLVKPEPLATLTNEAEIEAK